MCFFKNDTATSSEKEFLISYLQQVNRSRQVHVVPVNRVQRMWGMSNVWIVFPVIQYFHDIRPDQKWFVIMDDNTYLLMNAVRRLLMEVGRNKTHGELPVYMGTPLVDVERGHPCRIHRAKRTMERIIRKDVHFISGRGGIVLDRLAIARMFMKNATGTLST